MPKTNFSISLALPPKGLEDEPVKSSTLSHSERLDLILTNLNQLKQQQLKVDSEHTAKLLKYLQDAKERKENALFFEEDFEPGIARSEAIIDHCFYNLPIADSSLSIADSKIEDQLLAELLAGIIPASCPSEIIQAAHEITQRANNSQIQTSDDEGQYCEFQPLGSPKQYNVQQKSEDFREDSIVNAESFDVDVEREIIQEMGEYLQIKALKEGRYYDTIDNSIFSQDDLEDRLVKSSILSSSETLDSIDLDELDDLDEQKSEHSLTQFSQDARELAGKMSCPKEGPEPEVTPNQLMIDEACKSWERLGFRVNKMVKTINQSQNPDFSEMAYFLEDLTIGMAAQMDKFSQMKIPNEDDRGYNSVVSPISSKDGKLPEAVNQIPESRFSETEWTTDEITEDEGLGLQIQTPEHEKIQEHEYERIETPEPESESEYQKLLFPSDLSRWHSIQEFYFPQIMRVIGEISREIEECSQMEISKEDDGYYDSADSSIFSQDNLKDRPVKSSMLSSFETLDSIDSNELGEWSGNESLRRIGLGVAKLERIINQIQEPRFSETEKIEDEIVFEDEELNLQIQTPEYKKTRASEYGKSFFSSDLPPGWHATQNKLSDFQNPEEGKVSAKTGSNYFRTLFEILKKSFLAIRTSLSSPTFLEKSLRTLSALTPFPSYTVYKLSDKLVKECTKAKERTKAKVLPVEVKKEIKNKEEPITVTYPANITVTLTGKNRFFKTKSNRFFKKLLQFPVEVVRFIACLIRNMKKEIVETFASPHTKPLNTEGDTASEGESMEKLSTATQTMDSDQETLGPSVNISRLEENCRSAGNFAYLPKTLHYQKNVNNRRRSLLQDCRSRQMSPAKNKIRKKLQECPEKFCAVAS